MTTCWAMISLARCAALPHQMEVSVPLYYGSPFAPAPLATLHEAARRKPGALLRLPLGRAKAPALVFRAGPLPAGGGAGLGAAAAAAATGAGGAAAGGWARALVAPVAAMPATMVASPELACAAAAWRLALADTLGRQQQQQQERAVAAGGWAAAAPAAVVGDAALAGFLGAARDGAVLGAFLSSWRAACDRLRAAAAAAAARGNGGGCPPGGCQGGEEGGDAADAAAAAGPAALVAAFRRCALSVAPLLHCATLPPLDIGNFAELAVRRAAVVEAFTTAPRGGGDASNNNKNSKRISILGIGGSSNSSSSACGSNSCGSGGSGRARHPVEALSLLAGGAFVHRAFDVAETRLEVGGAPAAPWLAL